MKAGYVNDLLKYIRRLTRVVNIGGVPLGGDHPIRLQSMTNTPTAETASTVDQIIRIAEKGADYVRVTVQGKKEADNLPHLKAELAKKNYTIPLIADIHFNPKVACMAARIVDKVRINPGNYVDKKLFRSIEYTDTEYQAELNILRGKLTELIDICKENKTALRIGTNHGSLSDRIMNRYGDTPEGMAESAMEFLRICQAVHFHDVVVSMKASNTHIMVQATRLLISKMNDEDMDYPVHLGVTEAGEGEDGRIRSAVGIGALLADGIGDTIRVSLTEDPELEIPVAKKMIDYLKLRLHHKPVPSFGDYPIDPFHYTRRITDPVGILGGKNVSGVFHSLHGPVNYENLSRIGWRFSEKKGWHFTDLAPDFLIVDQWPLEMPPPKNRGILTQQDHEHPAAAKIQKIMTFDQFISQKEPVSEIHFVSVSASRIDHETIQHLRQNDQTVLILETDHPNGYADQRAALFRLINDGCRLPVVLKRRYYEYEGEDLQLKASMDLGGLFIDGLGDGIWIENTGEVPDEIIVSAAFGILQAGRVRISKTEFISCPSCGRTLFDLQSTTKKIREKTQHLKGLKIGIMGCIVNGPGEMADADYGYVGAAKGHVTLYKEKNVVRKNVPEHEAVDALISLIKENNDWTEPESP